MGNSCAIVAPAPLLALVVMQKYLNIQTSPQQLLLKVAVDTPSKATGRSKLGHLGFCGEEQHRKMNRGKENPLNLCQIICSACTTLCTATLCCPSSWVSRRKLMKIKVVQATGAGQYVSLRVIHAGYGTGVIPAWDSSQHIALQVDPNRVTCGQGREGLKGW